MGRRIWRISSRRTSAKRIAKANIELSSISLELESMADTQIQHVSDTAFWIAYYRGLETKRTDALFRDPLAERLAGERGEKISRAMPGGFLTAWAVAIRTCIIDDYIRTAIEAGVDTILNLGAGLDTRPYRMDLPESLRWVEADYPDLIAFKESRLANEKPRCRLERVKVDLANQTERQRLFHSVDAQSNKTLILTEGVIPYLSEADVGRLADELKGLHHSRFWIVDYFAPEVRKFRQRMQRRRMMQNAPLKFWPADWFGFFEAHGWRRKEIRYLAEEGDRLKRPIRLSIFLKFVLHLRMVFLSKGRRGASKRFVGYALLERDPLLQVFRESSGR
jgi:methyltransferase (TIGR00027 family)